MWYGWILETILHLLWTRTSTGHRMCRMVTGSTMDVLLPQNGWSLGQLQSPAPGVHLLSYMIDMGLVAEAKPVLPIGGRIDQLLEMPERLPVFQGLK